jgi:hypothetical protein
LPYSYYYYYDYSNYGWGTVQQNLMELSELKFNGIACNNTTNNHNVLTRNASSNVITAHYTVPTVQHSDNRTLERRGGGEEKRVQRMRMDDSDSDDRHISNE